MTAAATNKASAQPNEPPPPDADTAAAAHVGLPPAPPPTTPPPPPPPPGPSMAPPSQSPLKLESANGSSVRFGLLFQPQLQVNNNDALNSYAYNLFVRRTRFLVGGTLFGVVDYFFDTDFPNLQLATYNAGAMGALGTTTKPTTGLNIQDAFVTFKPLGDMLKVDFGYMLPPLSHNAVQGATTLYSWDYFDFTFQHSTGANAMAFGTAGNPVGRDAGVQLRGLVANHVEYRLGLFQGVRDPRTATDIEARNFFRVAARVQANVFDPETGFFYAGSYLGAKSILSIGGAIDWQKSPGNDYIYWAADAILDMPIGPGVVTGQVDYAHFDGGALIATLPKQNTVFGEAGFLVSGINISPIVRAGRDFVSGPNNDNTRLGGGVAWWPYGHNVNVKLFYTHIKAEAVSKATNQVNLQTQVYFF